MSLKDQAARIVGPGDRVAAVLDDLGHQQRELHVQIAAIDVPIAELRQTTLDLAAEIAAMREQLRRAVDDLGDRIGALSARLDQLGD